MNIKAHLNLPSVKELMKSVGLNEEGKVQKYIDNFVLYHSEPYLPGKHIHTPHANKLGSGEVIWNTPDANNLYEGKLMVDPITLTGGLPIRDGKISFNEADGDIEGFVSRKNVQKIMDPKGRDLNYHGGGLRGSKWFDRMINAEMDELIKGVENIINGK